MNKTSKKIRIAVVLGVVMALIISSMGVSYASSGTKTMTVYCEVIVKGGYAYCAANRGIYRVNLKTGDKKRIVKETGDPFEPGPGAMKIHKGYLYYSNIYPDRAFLYRVKLNGTNNKRLAEIDFKYAISKGKIYYECLSKDRVKTLKKVMKLNGKSKKKSSYKVKQINRRSNKSNYKIKTVFVQDETVYDEHYDDYIVLKRYAEYLTTPDGRSIKLCTYAYN